MFAARPGQLDVWIGPHETGIGFRACHLAFSAVDRATVDQFFRAAHELRAEILLPGERPGP